MTKIIELYGGPGTGKSTTAAGLFHRMKTERYKVELVTEYAKDLVYEERHNVLSDQLYIMAKQYRRVSRLLGKVDYIITDSPVLLSKIYGSNPNLHTLVDDLYEGLDVTKIFLNRVKPYYEYGRLQKLKEAKKLDEKIRELSNNFITLDADEEASDTIFEIICSLETSNIN